MQLMFIKELFGTQLMQAICWSLVHSLWQGLLVAIIAGIIILVTKRSGPVLRYNLLASLLLLFLVMIGTTFIREWNLNHPGASISGIQTPASPEIIQLEAATAPTEAVTDAPTPSFTSRMVAYCNEHAALIVAIWFIVFSARVVKLLAELGTIQRLKHYKTYTPAAVWLQTLETLAVQLKVSRTVQLLESGIVKVPVVIGFLKPVILMPLGLLANLPPHQVEAILLHELAHIKRRDYLVNLLQHFAESIFFFNPAVLWISSLIREEREHCCDDMAIAITHDKKQFVHALVAFQQYNMSASGYAMAFPGKKDHLLNRVKRLVNNNNKTLNAMEKSLLMACLLITGMLTFVYAQRANTPLKPPGIASTVEKDKSAYSHERNYSSDQATPTSAKTTAGEAGQMRRDTAPAFRNRYYQPQDVKEGTRFTFTETFNGQPYTGYLAKKEGTLYQFGKQNNKVIFLRIDGKDIDAAGIPAHEPVLQELLSSFQAAVQPVKPVEAEEAPAVKAIEEKTAAVKPVPSEASITAFGNLSVTGNNVRMNKGIISNKNSTRYFGKGYEVVEENGKIVKVRFDNKELTSEEITMQQAEIHSVINEAKMEEERGRLESIKKAAQDAYDRSLRERDRREKAVQDEQVQQEAIQRKINDRRIRQDSIHQRNMERKIETQQRVDLRQANAVKLADKDRMITLQKIEHLNKELQMEQVKLEQLNAKQNIQLQTPKYRSTPPVYKPFTETYKPGRSAFDDIRKELVKEGIIEKDATMVAITLNDTQLIVNGVEQSPALHKRLKEKYSPKGNLTYTTLMENTNKSDNNNKNDNRKQ